MVRIAWACAAALAFCGCGGGGGGEDHGEATATPDPSVQRLGAACTEYREAVLAELPPASPAAHPAYMGERRRLVKRLIAAIRKEPAEGEGIARRGRLLATASELLAVVDNMVGPVGPTESLAGILYGRSSHVGLYETKLDQAAEQGGVPCGRPSKPSAQLQEFRERAGDVCDDAGSPTGLPRRDAELIRERVDGHAELPLPADATDLERDTLAAERELARVAARTPPSPTIRDADARYIALATRTSEGWRRQQVKACVDLPVYEL